MRLDEDQQQLQTAVRKLAGEHAELARQAVEGGDVDDSAVWGQIAGQMGLAGIAIPEEHGGAAGTYVDLALALEELGRQLVPSPLFATAALAVPLLTAAGDEQAMARWLPRIAAGELRATVGFSPAPSVTADADGTLRGSVERVVGAATADLILVLAQTASGPTVFGVEGTADGLIVEDLPVLDPTRPIATVHLDRTPAVAVDAGADAVRRALLTARVMLAAEQVGGAARCLDMAVEYAKSRVQFSRPIGSFQSIKHLCADIYADVESARALTYDAAEAIAGGGDRLATLAGMAGGFATDAFVAAAERNMQVHGGISYTWEHDCHLYLRRARSSAQLITSPRQDYAAVATGLGL